MSLNLIKDSESNSHTSNVAVIFPLQDGSKILSGSDDGIIKVWSPDLEFLSEVNLNKGAIVSAVAGPNNVYTITSDQTITSWDANSLISTGELTTTLNVPSKLYYEGKNNVLWAGDGTGSVANFLDGKERGKYEIMEEIWDLIVEINDGKPLVYTARDRDISVHLIGSGIQAVTKATMTGRSPIYLFKNHLIFLSRDGRQIVVTQHDVANKFPILKEIPAADVIINAITCREDNDIFVGGYDNKITCWDLVSGEKKGCIDTKATVNAMITGPKGCYAALADGRVILVG